jgi:hypothetical protein
MKRKRMNSMPALLKFLVLLALVLSASHANAFTSLSSAAGNQVRVNHLTRLQQPMSDPTNEPSHEPIREPTKRLGQDALLPGNLSSKRVFFLVSMMDDEIQSCKTHSEYTKSYQVAIPVSFVSFHSKSLGLAYCCCWVHSHWKTTADLFNAQHSIQFACIRRSFISARVLTSTFDGFDFKFQNGMLGLHFYNKSPVTSSNKSCSAFRMVVQATKLCSLCFLLGSPSISKSSTKSHSGSASVS